MDIGSRVAETYSIPMLDWYGKWSAGIFAGMHMLNWWCRDHSGAMVLGLFMRRIVHSYWRIFKNMDANLEEAATGPNTPRRKILWKITTPDDPSRDPFYHPACVWQCYGSYPVPHYLGLTTLATKYICLNSKYTGEASILAVLMMVFGVAILALNQISLRR